MRGDITVDGHPKDAATFARVSGYVEQVQIAIIFIIFIITRLFKPHRA